MEIVKCLKATKKNNYKMTLKHNLYECLENAIHI